MKKWTHKHTHWKMVRKVNLEHPRLALWKGGQRSVPVVQLALPPKLRAWADSTPTLTSFCKIFATRMWMWWWLWKHFVNGEVHIQSKKMATAESSRAPVQVPGCHVVVFQGVQPGGGERSLQAIQVHLDLRPFPFPRSFTPQLSSSHWSSGINGHKDSLS